MEHMWPPAVAMRFGPALPMDPFVLPRALRLLRRYSVPMNPARIQDCCNREGHHSGRDALREDYYRPDDGHFLAKQRDSPVCPGGNLPEAGDEIGFASAAPISDAMVSAAADATLPTKRARKLCSGSHPTAPPPRVPRSRWRKCSGSPGPLHATARHPCGYPYLHLVETAPRIKKTSITRNHRTSANTINTTPTSARKKDR